MGNNSRGRDIRLLKVVAAIGIAAIFLVMLPPVSSQVKEDGELDMCALHLKKIWQAQMMYVADNDGYMALNLFNLNPYLCDENGKKLGYKETDIPEELSCPSVPYPLRPKVFWATDYGLNGYMAFPHSWFTTTTDQSRKNKYSLYGKPAETMLAMDKMPDPSGNSSETVLPSSFTTKNPLMFRHNGGVNVLFLDGHVKWMPADAVVVMASTDPFWSCLF